MERKYLGIVIGISVLLAVVVPYGYLSASNVNTGEAQPGIPVNQTLPVKHSKNYSINLDENVGLTSK